MKGTVGGDACGRGVVQGRANGEKASGGGAPEVHCSSPRDLQPASPIALPLPFVLGAGAGAARCGSPECQAFVTRMSPEGRGAVCAPAGT